MHALLFAVPAFIAANGERLVAFSLRPTRHFVSVRYLFSPAHSAEQLYIGRRTSFRMRHFFAIIFATCEPWISMSRRVRLLSTHRLPVTPSKGINGHRGSIIDQCPLQIINIFRVASWIFNRFPHFLHSGSEGKCLMRLTSRIPSLQPISYILNLCVYEIVIYLKKIPVYYQYAKFNHAN